MKRLILYLFCILHCTIYNIKFAISQPSGNLPIRNYPYTEYHAKQNNMSIVQDQRGIMYFANEFGVLEYDGVEWRLIYTENKSIVHSLSIDTNGAIYVGAEGEFGYLAPDSTGNLKFYSLIPFVNKSDGDFNEVWETFATEKGIYFSTMFKIFRWDGFKIKVWDPQTAFHVMFCVPAPAIKKQVEIYVRQYDIGLMKMVVDSLTLIHEGDKFADKKIYGIFPFRKNELLIVTRGHGLYTMNHYSDYLKKESPGIFPFNTKTDVFLLNSGVYYGTVINNNLYSIGTLDNGAVIINEQGNPVRYLDYNSGILSNEVAYQYPDKQNNLWF